MQEVMITILLAAAVIFAAYKTVMKFRKGGGCCGEHEQAEKSVDVRGRKKKDYPCQVRLRIYGMTCAGCARRVENALNSTDGIWARVDLNSNTATVRMRDRADESRLPVIAAKAGYRAEIVRDK
ncbi:MAG: heavy-metal-associated domain-containing protein [Ruminococcus sp.]|nr:heavy-metal-associated domain-containing protein [Ruminococcus sp.]MBR2284639.1 heavy-metal-associated domain-containing protein [Ruminococcus sp.]